MKKVKITITMTEQEAEWLEQACFVEEDFPHSKFLNRVSRVARRARHAFQQSVYSDAGKSAASTSLSNTSAESTSQTETKPAQRG